MTHGNTQRHPRFYNSLFLSIFLLFGDGVCWNYFSSVKENVSETDLETVNEETDFSLQTRENDTNL